jgi:hypothetical protein
MRLVREETVADRSFLNDTPRPVATRFEVAAARMAETWARAGQVEVSVDDLGIAKEFLQRAGMTVEASSGQLVRLVHRDGRSEEMTRAAVMVLAFRRLAALNRSS